MDSRLRIVSDRPPRLDSKPVACLPTGLFTAEEDVAKVLVKVINDPRASNRKLIIRGQARTQNEMVDAFEAASGKKLERVLISREQLEQQLQGEWLAHECAMVHCQKAGLAYRYNASLA